MRLFTRGRSLFMQIMAVLSTTAALGQADCITAVPITAKGQITVDRTKIGPLGAFNEPGSCFTGAERAPYWFSFEVCKTGSLELFIDPTNTADFDYALFDITNGCGSKFDVACNYQSSTGTANITGIGCDNGASCDPSITVQAGRTYAVLFSRFTAAQEGFTLFIGGSFEIFNPADFDFKPQITGDTAVCGFSQTLSAAVAPGVDLLWSASGPGNVTFDAINSASTGVMVDQPGTYTLRLTSSKNLCGDITELSDSLMVTFNAVNKNFTGSLLKACASSIDLIDLRTGFSGVFPSGGTWSDLDASGRLEPNGFFNAYQAGGQTYRFAYTIPAQPGICLDLDDTVQVQVSEPLSIRRDSIACFNAGQNYRMFFTLGGGDPTTYEANGFDIVGTYYGTGFYPNGFTHQLTLSDQSGCPSTVLVGQYDCNCATQAAELLPTAAIDCQQQSVQLQIAQPAISSVGQVEEFILFTDETNPIGSIVARSLTPAFSLGGSITSGIVYYAAAALGTDNGSGQVDLNGACLSLSVPIRVRFPDSGIITLSGDTAICEEQIANLRLDYSGNDDLWISLFDGVSSTNRLVQPGLNLLAVQPTSTTTYTITTAVTLYDCPVNTSGNAVVEVNKRAGFNATLINDSVACLNALTGNPTLAFFITNSDTITPSYSINGQSQNSITGVTNGTIYTLPKLTSGKNTIVFDGFTSQVSGCSYAINPVSIDYYYLDEPVVSLLASKQEVCSFGDEVKLAFSSSSNLNTRIYYRINGVPLFEDVLGSKVVSIPVTTNLSIELDSASYPTFEACSYGLQGSATVDLFTRPALIYQLEQLTCIDSSARLVIQGGESIPFFSVNASPFSKDTIYEFDSEGSQALEIRLGQNCIYEDSVLVNRIPPFTLSVEVTDTKCGQANGSIVPQLNGSFVLPITYRFNNSSKNTNLPAGNYLIEATDATGCKVSLTDNIASSAPFIVQAQALDTVLCAVNNTARIAVSASGGDGTVFTYSIDGINFTPTDTIDNLQPQIYTVYAQNEVGCLDSVEVKILADEALAINVSVLQFLRCFESKDASFAVNVSNSSQSLQYAINGGAFTTSNFFDNVGPGTVQFRAIELGGCRREDRVLFEVTRPEKLSLQQQSKGNPSCFNINNGFIVVQAQGGTSAYTYSLDEGMSFQSSGVFTGLTGGQYLMVAQNADGCKSDTLSITLDSPPVISIVQINETINLDQTGNIEIIAQGGFPPLRYSLNDVAYLTTNLFENQAQGPYRVYVRDNKGCKVSEDIYLGTVSVQDISADLGVQLFPNPSNGQAHITGAAGESYSYEIMDVSGRLMSSGQFVDAIQLDTHKWPAGVYQVRVGTAKGMQIIKLMVQ
ncbi:MAG TPA: T9SS type A sorting domain-containing protein [Luteibaculaceae bacterium]|nr:T9SS type A sorting domain-containing protein [Luteibaculaceae bacterium]